MIPRQELGFLQFRPIAAGPAAVRPPAGSPRPHKLQQAARQARIPDDARAAQTAMMLQQMKSGEAAESREKMLAAEDALCPGVQKMMGARNYAGEREKG